MIEFVLVEPAVPENVGATARALKTMGFSSLAVVNSAAHEDAKASWLAHGSADILKSVRVFPTLAEALAGSSLVIGTTARKRSFSRIITSSRELRGIIERKQGSCPKISVVFGRENSGLTNDELLLCDILSYVPLASDFPSLNLSQAVMIFAYELSSLAAQPVLPQSGDASFSEIRNRFSELLDRLGFDADDVIRARVYERLALAGAKDIKVVHAVLGRVMNIFKESDR